MISEEKTMVKKIYAFHLNMRNISTSVYYMLKYMNQLIHLCVVC